MSAAPEFLYLTTRGRRSGQPREIEIWFTARAGRWVQNLAVEPRVHVRVGDASFPARARVVYETVERDLSAAVQELSERKYGWGEGLVVELTPER